MAKKIRIKDIAERAGVSTGTVDRVLHNRPNISPKARAQVEKALKELDYQPNVYASALALNRSYHFGVMLPKHRQVTYWEEVERGVDLAVKARRDFNVSADFIYYDRFDDNSFNDAAKRCMAGDYNGVVMVPVGLDTTRLFTDRLHAAGVPFVMLDSYMAELKPLAFYGQDSFSSGFFAARMLMLLASGDEEIALMKVTNAGRVVSEQQHNREEGFRSYMGTHFPCVGIVELELPFYGTKRQYYRIMERFFAAHPRIHHCITLGSKAHIMGEFLLSQHRRDIQIMGYDMVQKNADCLRQGSISFLIAQHACQQGYLCLDALVRSVVMKQQVQGVNYMPIELLTQENVDFYRRMQV